MPQYIRAFVPGGRVFFAVALLEPRRKRLTKHRDNLWAWFMAARHRWPFTVEASLFCPFRRLEIE